MADAMKLVLELAKAGADKAGCDGWRAQQKCRQIVELLERASPPVSERERELEGALRNLLGAFDTPIARRRLPPTDFSRAAIDQARALTAQPAGEGE